MKPPADGWDRAERDVLDLLSGELDAVRARHQDDPPIAMMRAAQADALPDELLTAKMKSASQSAWGRALVEPLESAERPLSVDDEARLLQRIRSAIGDRRPSAGSWTWLRWATVAATAVVAVVAVVKWVGQSPAPTTPVHENPVVARSAAPQFVLALEKPEVKLSVVVLTVRGAGDDHFLSQLTKALDAFRAGHFTDADRQLTAIEPKHPVFDVYFYQGLSRLFLNDATGALAPLQKAASLADPVFAADVEWYTAVAEERAGLLTKARDRITDLCRTSTAYSQRACQAQKQFAAAHPVRPPS